MLYSIADRAVDTLPKIQKPVQTGYTDASNSKGLYVYVESINH